MKALVTGATGFVGGHLVEALVRRGDQVTALVRSPARATLLNRLPVRQVSGGLDRSALAQAVAGQEMVFHVAGLVAARDEAEFLRANRDGTATLIDAMHGVFRAGDAAPRLVLVSSFAAAGPSHPGRPLRGDEPPHPVTQYGRSKLAGEDLVRQSGLPWTIVRPPMVYGPRDTEVLKVFRMARRGLAAVFGDGQQELNAVYAPDLAEALVVAGASRETVEKTYFACHREVFTSAAFVEAVGQAVRRLDHSTPDRKPPPRHAVRLIHLPPLLARVALTLTGAAAHLTGRATILTADKAREFLAPAWTGDPAPLERDAGWRAGHDLAAGLLATAQWYRAAEWL